MKTSYKQKFIILFLLFGFVVVAISFSALFYTQSKSIKEEFFKTSKTVTATKQELFESFFNRLQDTTISLSNALNTDGNLESFNNYTNLLLGENQDILKISLFNIQFESIKEVKRLTLSDPKNFDLQNLWLSDIERDKDNAYIFLQNPLKIGEESFVLSIAFSVNSLFEALEKSSIGYIHLVDETGKFIVYQDSFFKGKNLLLDNIYPDVVEDILFADYYIGLDMYSKKLMVGEKEYKIIFQMREDIIENKKDELLSLSFYILLAISLLSLPIAYLFAIIPDKLNRQLQDLNESLERRVEEEVALRREKEQMVIHQSKMAAMGEMIGAIGHQWRQPLNAIGLIAMTISTLFRRDKLNEESLKKEISQIENQLEFMSKTIDDFKNFFKKDKEKKTFDALKGAQEVITLISPQILKNLITVNFIYQEDGITKKELGLEEKVFKQSRAYVDGYYNEYKQVILNIINNAKDILIEKKIENKLTDIILDKKIENGIINIVINRTDESIFISIEDNGGGIPEDIIEKIFTPYFSTKGDKGTGIGLDLAKKIIEENMQGVLQVENTQIGAKFTIELPISKEKLELTFTEEIELEKEEEIKLETIDETTEETPLIKEKEIAHQKYVEDFLQDLSFNKEKIVDYDDSVYKIDENSNIRF